MIVFGLGNPGPKYSKSRHNVGFMAIEKLAAQEGLSLRKRCLHSYKWARKGSLTLVEPLTYMNNSGLVFPSLVKGEDMVVVIVDNMDLPVGRIRVKNGGGDAGHNGLKSIIGRIGRDFLRIYVGVGRPDEGVAVAEHVLSAFPEDDLDRLDASLDKAVEAVKALIAGEKLSNVIQRANTF
ncbi:MAG TPA: aminoacyl-tRNA hydrolase [Candidatus Ornithospirochaeta stercorigallinarum]|nr:aminoacyl-tRNA hydrolase [Candidatus Ornithospirochaeta stercorigallinarum]